MFIPAWLKFQANEAKFGCLVLRPVHNYGHKSPVPMVTIIRVLYCIFKPECRSDGSNK